MADVFPDLPNHPDYLPLADEVSRRLGVEPRLVIPRPVRIAGERKSRQAWSWFWMEDLSDGDVVHIVKRSARLLIDIHDPWHNDPWHRYTVKAHKGEGLWVTVETAERPPPTPEEVRKVLVMANLLPYYQFSTDSLDNGDKESW